MKYNKRLESQDAGVVDNDLFQFTWRQHFLTYAAMKKFCGQNEKIYTVNKANNKVSYAKLKRFEPGAVSVRGWTQHIEKEFSHPIESNYLSVINKLIDSKPRALFSTENLPVIKYLALWSARFSFKDSDSSINVYGNFETMELTPFERQCLEQRNTQQAGVIQKHESNSQQIKSLYESIVNDLSGIQFILHKVQCDMNLVLPDKTNLLCLPISSNSILIPDSISFDGQSVASVSSLNMQMLNQSDEYYWVEDINKVVRC
ncbi:hypothetical protein VA7868_01692 [Vibrio aerogenes CECT 7868]|uniref:Uncharacterized protein n=1 Tax=Vibrio aerogenes CECT 7868 TaxID=1216006 RepID=A0A1M5YFB6_9VIBR|nr:hypothetical protein [Vibrio aerogenes]SHI10761.1 hypothetical protein VA7868_01692 [Vibrio aerogenes CECT 7868]